MAEPLLVLSGVEVRYQANIDAVRDLSLAVPQGGIVALLGANGAGKSSTLKAISGFLPLQRGRIVAGRISFAGSDIIGTAPHHLVRRGLVHVREGRHVFADMTVEENLIAGTFALTGRKGTRKGFDEIYEYFPILAERRHGRAGYLSGGEQQMLAIGRALVGEPRMIMLDEPSLGLAPMIAAEIFAIITRINRDKGVTILLVEQNAALALGCAGYAYVMENGHVAAEGEAAVLAADAVIRELYLGVTSDGAARSFRN